MQDINPKDRPKLYALIGASAVVLLIAGKTIYDSIIAVSPAPGAGAPSPSASTPAVAGVASTAPGSAPPAAAGAFVLDGRMGATPNGRDPFTPVSDAVLAAASVRPKSLIPKPEPSPTPVAVPGVGVVGGVVRGFANGLVALDKRNKILHEIDGIDKAPVIPPPTLRVLPPPPPPYTVSGVLIGESGERDVAILKHDGADDDKRFVVVGDALEGGYTVAAIESGGVVVKHPGRRPSTTVIPGAPPATVGEVTYRLKQTTRVPAVTTTLPLEPATGTPGATRAK